MLELVLAKIGECLLKCTVRLVFLIQASIA